MDNERYSSILPGKYTVVGVIDENIDTNVYRCKYLKEMMKIKRFILMIELI